MAAAWHEGFAEVVGELTLQQETVPRVVPRLGWAQHRNPRAPRPRPAGGQLRPLPAAAVGREKRVVRRRTARAGADAPGASGVDAAGRDAADGRHRRARGPGGVARRTSDDDAPLPGRRPGGQTPLHNHRRRLNGRGGWPPSCTWPTKTNSSWAGVSGPDPREIDERLGEVVLHMEKVLQKYLRNEFETLDEFNRRAGEVAEPYHVVVVSGFPKGLTDNAIRKLERIAMSGARCGVFTLLGVDTSEQLPNDFDLSALTQGAVHLDWLDGRMVWRYPLYEKLALEIEPLPERRRMTDLLVEAGRRSREASRVEVPFAEVAPKEEQLWTGDASRELVVPIGRAGATDTQALSLGRGTAQHVLVGGQDRLRQEHPAPRAGDQHRPALQPRRGRALPGRLQERRRVQSLRQRQPATRAGDRHRERAGVRRERAGAARRRAPPPGRVVPPAGRAEPGPTSAAPPPTR